MPISLKAASGGSGTPLGSIIYFPQYFPVNFEDSTTVYLRSGYIETDSGKFDSDYWQDSLGTVASVVSTNSINRRIPSVAHDGANKYVYAIKGSSTNKGGVAVSTDGGKTIVYTTEFTEYDVTQGTNDVIYVQSLSLWVAIGDKGVIKTSPDAVTWTTRSSGLTVPLNKVEWNGSTFVIVPSSVTQVLTSTNGTSWTSRTLPTESLNQDRDAISYGNNVWVILVGGSAVITSSDATTWTWTSVNSTFVSQLPLGLVYDNSKFVIMTNSGKSYTSVNGTSWTATGLNSPTQVNNLLPAISLAGSQSFVYYSGYYYLATGSNTFCRSKDLNLWSRFKTLSKTADYSNIASVVSSLKVSGNKLHLGYLSTNLSITEVVGYMNSALYAGITSEVRSNDVLSNDDTYSSNSLIGYVRIK